MTRAERLGIEPAASSERAHDSGGPAFTGEISASVAISLKRIADALEAMVDPQDNRHLAGSIYAAISNALAVSR